MSSVSIPHPIPSSLTVGNSASSGSSTAPSMQAGSANAPPQSQLQGLKSVFGGGGASQAQTSPTNISFNPTNTTPHANPNSRSPTTPNIVVSTEIMPADPIIAPPMHLGSLATPPKAGPLGRLVRGAAGVVGGSNSPTNPHSPKDIIPMIGVVKPPRKQRSSRFHVTEHVELEQLPPLTGASHV